jgi:hypothetical protein
LVLPFLLNLNTFSRMRKNEELKLTLECDIKGVKRIKRNFQDSNIFYWIFKKKKTKNIEFEFKKTSYFSVKVL